MTLLVGVIMENWRSGKKETEKKNGNLQSNVKPTGMTKKKLNKCPWMTKDAKTKSFHLNDRFHSILRIGMFGATDE